MIKSGIAPDERKSLGNETPLMRAAYYGKLDVLKFLLEKGADISLTDHRGNTALLHAAWSGHTKVVRELLKQGANINERNKLNWNALMQASLEGHYSTAKLLLDKDSPTDEIDKEKGATALTLAKHSHSQKIIDLLILHGAKERKVRKRNKDEAYFSIFDCDICFYLPHKKDLANSTSPDKFKGLELIFEENTTPDRYTDDSEMIKKCSICGTYYHHDHSIDDEDSFISGPNINQNIQRYNLLQLKLVLKNIKKEKELKEFEKKYTGIIESFESKITEIEGIKENILPFVIESLTDYYIMNNDWESLYKNLLQHSNDEVVLKTAEDLIQLFYVKYYSRKYPRKTYNRDFVIEIQDKFKKMFDKHSKELYNCIQKYKNSKNKFIERKYSSIMSSADYHKIFKNHK